MKEINLSEMTFDGLRLLKMHVEAELAQRAADPRVLHVTAAPDEYHGDYSCIRILDPHELKIVRKEDQGATIVETVIKGGVPVAELTSRIGSNGRGRLAAQSIRTLGSARIEWVEDWRPET